MAVDILELRNRHGHHRRSRGLRDPRPGKEARDSQEVPSREAYRSRPPRRSTGHHISRPLQLRLEPSAHRGMAKSIRLRNINPRAPSRTRILLQRAPTYSITTHPLPRSVCRRRIRARRHRVRMVLLRHLGIQPIPIRPDPAPHLPTPDLGAILSRRHLGRFRRHRHRHRTLPSPTRLGHAHRPDLFHRRRDPRRHRTRRANLLGPDLCQHHHHAMGDGHVIPRRHADPQQRGQEGTSGRGGEFGKHGGELQHQFGIGVCGHRGGACESWGQDGGRPVEGV